MKLNKPNGREIRGFFVVIFSMFLLINNSFWSYNIIIRVVLLIPYCIYSIRFIYFVDMIVMVPFTKTYRIVKTIDEFEDLELLDVFSLIGAKMVLFEVNNNTETIKVRKFILGKNFKSGKYCKCYKPLNGDSYIVLDWGEFLSSFLNLILWYWVLKIPLIFPELSKYSELVI